MKRTFKIAAIVMALSTATAAVAAVDTNRLIADFQAQGYSNVQVNNRGGEVEVTAMAGTRQMTFVYDAVSGVLLRRDGVDTSVSTSGNGIGTASADVTGDIAPGTGVGGDDSGTDDHGTDTSNSDDSGTDDHGTDTSNSDDNGTDDHGTDTSNSNDSGTDDHGTDTSNSNDSGNDSSNDSGNDD